MPHSEEIVQLYYEGANLTQILDRAMLDLTVHPGTLLPPIGDVIAAQIGSGLVTGVTGLRYIYRFRYIRRGIYCLVLVTYRVTVYQSWRPWQ